jgi:hypothetical protein
MYNKLKIVSGASALLALAACASGGGPVHDVYYDGYHGLLDGGSEASRLEAQCAGDDRKARPCADAQDQEKHGQTAQGL